MGAVSQVMSNGQIHRKDVQRVQMRNHPPYGANKFKRLLCGDPVKDTVYRMKAFLHAKDVQEECCIRLQQLAKGEFYNGLVGEYGGIELVLRVIQEFSDDSLLVYAAIPALTQFAQNGPNAEILRNLNADRVLDELRKRFHEDEYIQKDCEEFIARIQVGLEYVENSVIEEDIAALLKYMRRYYDLVDVVEYGMSMIETFLNEDESNVIKFIEGGDLTTFKLIIDANKNHFQTMYHVFSIIYILAGNPALSSELGKAGLLKAALEMVREKKSGKQGELLQVAIFALSRMCYLETNAILFHKLCGDVLFDEIDEAIRDDQYEYPIVLPLRLREMVRKKAFYLRRDDEAAKALHPDRAELIHDRKMFQGESLIQALVLKRPDAVISQKKDQERWKHDGVDLHETAVVEKPSFLDSFKKKGKPVKEVPQSKYAAEDSTVIEIQHEGWDPDDPDPPKKGGEDW